MYGGNPRVLAELASDMWIERNIPGGLNSPLGQYLDNIMGGNPNPTHGQRFAVQSGLYPRYSYPFRWY
ncbi:unnamed protein product [Rotaria sp. Silwood1]|nr:unnamed protein product [Rotaria sp. Silwood1]CAF4950256.1 unnamed protein product [Rotaria sp. Silwood1]